jgi:cyclomaltodextrin glucanotransferase
VVRVCMKVKIFGLSLLVLVMGYMMPALSNNKVADYRSRTIYFILVDRFHDHHPAGHPYIDPQYPDATNKIDCFSNACDSNAEWRKYWGGDIQGITEKIDYLKKMGIGAVWVTPLMENVRAYVPKTGWGTGYHGYWVQNYDRVNRHFGSWGDVNAFAAALHKNKMRYIQDITLNHSNPYDSHINGALYQSSSADIPRIISYHDDYDLKNKQHFYKHFQEDRNFKDRQRCKVAATLADGQWSYWQLHHCLLGTLSGFNQHDPIIHDYLIHAGQLWMQHGVDDFRLDAVKYVYPDFVAAFTKAIRKYAHKTPYIIGEWSEGGVGNKKSLQFESDYSHYHTNLLDFKTSFALNRFIQGRYFSKNNPETATQLDLYFHQRVVAFKGRDTWQGVFLDNHDEIRSLVRLQKLHVNDENERENRLDLGTVLMMTIRGIPIIYYGDEQYLANYNDHHVVEKLSTINTADDDPYNRSGMKQWNEHTSAFKIIQILAKLRKTNPAIQKGKYVSIYAKKGVLVFERAQGSKRVLIAVNRGPTVNVRIPSSVIRLTTGKHENLLSGASALYASNSLDVHKKESVLHLNRLSAFVATSS